MAEARVSAGTAAPQLESAPSRHARHAPVASGAAPHAAALLALQRTAGNRAVARALAAPQRALARCAGRCTCGGTCATHDDRFEEDPLHRAMLGRAVLARDIRRENPSPAPDAGTGKDGGGSDATEEDGGLAPDNPSHEQDPSVTIGVCGPDVSTPLRTTLGQMAADFGLWSPADKRAACRRVLFPLDLTGAGAKPSADLNGWDIHALFQGEAQWLRRAPVCPPCATPSSSAPGNAGWAHKGHEDPRTCSDTVQVGSACWLAGTPNYGAFGMILRLCAGELAVEAQNPDSDWPQDFLEHGKAMIRGYKLLVSKEDPKWPLAWTEAVFRGGASATLAGGNRQSCTTTCSKLNPKARPETLANWDYVWEPVHPRYKIAPATPAPSASGAPAPSDAGVP